MTPLEAWAHMSGFLAWLKRTLGPGKMESMSGQLIGAYYTAGFIDSAGSGMDQEPARYNNPLDRRH